jgi:hypothetical protein
VTQIYCDESGGFDKDKHSLIVSAIRITFGDAARLMKQFRKATKLSDEIKGGLLSEKERSLFFDMLGDIEYFGAAVGCHKTSDAGSVLPKSFPERDIYQHMLMEACSPLIDMAVPTAKISADGGRYSRQMYLQMATAVEAKMSTESLTAKVEFIRSEDSPGVQIADIVANTVYKATVSGSYDLEVHATCGLLVRSGRLMVMSAKLQALKPTWMVAI